MMWMLLAAASAQDLTWTGIDYGLVTMVGTEDFRDPDAIFPAMMSKWNMLFRVEMQGELRRRLGTKSTDIQDGHLYDLHVATDADTQILRDDSLPYTKQLLSKVDVVARVASYPPRTGPMAVTFIAEQLNKPSRKGCYWVTFYDPENLVVHRTRRSCTKPGGIGFRNYWFGSVKTTLYSLKPTDVPPDDEWVTLTEAEIQAASLTRADLDASMESARERAAERAEQKKQAQADADRAAGRVPRDWVRIDVAPEGLAALKEAGVEFVVSSTQGQAPPPTQSRSGSSGVSFQWGASAGHSTSRDDDIYRTFTSFHQAVADETFDSNKTDMLQEATAHIGFTVRQAARVLELYTFDNERVKGACAIAPGIVDREHAEEIEEAFTFHSNGREAVACMR